MAVYVVGGGCIPFRKPDPDRDYPELGIEAGRLALQDAGLSAADVELAVVRVSLWVVTG